MKKDILILGSTGSIGKSTLDVIRNHPENSNAKVLIANSNVKLLLIRLKNLILSLLWFMMKMHT